MTTYYLFDSRVEQLMLANSEEVTAVNLQHPGMASRLGRALRASTHVKKLYLNITKIRTDEDLTLCLQFIESSSTLTKIGLFSTGDAVNTAVHRHLLFRGFLSAVLCNPSIKISILDGFNISTACLGLLLGSKTLTTVALQRCHVIRHDRGTTNDEIVIDERIIVAAFGSTTITMLSFGLVNSNIDFFRMALNGLKQNRTTNHKILELHAKGLDNVAEPMNTLPDFLQENPCTKISFIGVKWNHDTLHPIVKVLSKAGDRLAKLLFIKCSFDDSSCQLFGSVLQARPGRYVWLKGRTEFPERSSIFGSFLQGSEMQSWLCIYEDFRINGSSDLSPLFDMLKHKKCLLKRLHFDRLDEGQRGQLLDILPACRTLQHLSISDFGGNDHLCAKLVAAIRRNRSLHFLDIVNSDLTELDQTAISNYLLRNKNLPNMIKSACDVKNTNVSSVPALFWASAVATRATGPGDIFEGLCRLGNHVVAGGGVVNGMAASVESTGATSSAVGAGDSNEPAAATASGGDDDSPSSNMAESHSDMPSSTSNDDQTTITADGPVSKKRKI